MSNYFLKVILVSTTFLSCITSKQKQTGNVREIQVQASSNVHCALSEIQDKIFQPFFPTKLSGVGTGLRLCLSYDIVEVHNVEIKVKSMDSERTEFIIQRPLVL